MEGQQTPPQQPAAEQLTSEGVRARLAQADAQNQQLATMLQQMQQSQQQMQQAMLQMQQAQQASALAQAQAAGPMAALVQAPPNAIAEAVRAAGPDRSQQRLLVDNKGLGKPTQFNNKEEDFPAWRRKAENYVLAVFANGKVAMDMVDTLVSGLKAKLKELLILRSDPW